MFILGMIKILNRKALLAHVLIKDYYLEGRVKHYVPGCTVTMNNNIDRITDFIPVGWDNNKGSAVIIENTKYYYIRVFLSIDFQGV